MSNYDSQDVTLARFVGWLDAGMDAPTFLIPVFQDMDDDRIVLQVSSSMDTISSFMEAPSVYNKIHNQQNIVKKVGSKVIFGILLKNNKPFFAEIEAFVDKLSSLLASGEFDDLPAFALNVAKFVNNASQVDRFTKEIFSSVLTSSKSSKKYFLENDVIRGSLYRSTDIDRHDFIRRMRININGSKISLGLPHNTPEIFRQEFGQEITNIYKKFTESNVVEISFQDKDADSEIERMKVIDREILQIKSGYYPINPEVLDLPFIANYFSPREAIVVVPEVANRFLNSQLSRAQVVRMSVPQTFHRRPISESTIQRIVGLEPVSLLSVMLFRLWALSDVTKSKYSKSYEPHICCFAVKKDFHREFYNSEKLRSFFSAKAPPPFYCAFPMSLIYYLIRNNVISEKDARKVFEYRRGGVSVFYYVVSENCKKWTEFSMRVFPNLSKDLARDIFQSYLKGQMI